MADARNQERSGMNVIHLEIGDPDFDSPPNVIEAACDALRNGDTHYIIPSPQGWTNFELLLPK